MKRIILFYFLLCFSFSYAQNNGRVTYRITSKRIIIEGNEPLKKAYEQFMKLLLVRDSLVFNLDFNSNESLYYFDKKRDLGLSNEDGYEMTLHSFANSKFYKNVSENLTINQLNSDGIYLLNSSLHQYDWKFHKETKMINNYICYKAATIKKDFSPLKGIVEKNVVAWYCPEISIPTGPKEYGGLPGLILEVTEGKLTYYATSINLNPSEKLLIRRPVRGKKMTQWEYNDKQPVINKEDFKKSLGNN